METNESQQICHKRDKEKMRVVKQQRRYNKLAKICKVIAETTNKIKNASVSNLQLGKQM